MADGNGRLRRQDEEFWRKHPLGVTELSHVTVLFRDLNAAHRIYGEVLGGDLLHSEEIPGERRSAFYTLGPEVIIEALQPLNEASIAPLARPYISLSTASRSMPGGGSCAASGLDNKLWVTRFGETTDQITRNIAAGMIAHSATYQP